MTTPITSRPLVDDDDWWAVRRLIVDLFGRVPSGDVWEVRRWDGLRFHDEEPALPRRCRLWFAADRLVAAAFSEGEGPDVHLQVDPAHRDLEGEMLDWALDDLAVGGRLDHVVFDDDRRRARLAEALGFHRLDARRVSRSLRIGGDLPAPPPIPRGYGIRPTRADDADPPRMADLLNAAFGRDVHTAAEYRTFTRRSPSFRHDLNLVAEAPDGSFAAHVGLSYDEANRCAVVEPVCTHPDHRRRGLALALVADGLARAAGLGAGLAVVGTGGDEGPNRLYEAAGFTDARWGRVWRHQAGV